jgi:putative transposase
MKDWQSQTHVKWDCKYHVVIVPKYHQRVFFGRQRSQIGSILRDLCRQKEVELVKGNAQPAHIHLLLSIPPKYSVAMTVGYLKGKSDAPDKSLLNLSRIDLARNG